MAAAAARLTAAPVADGGGVGDGGDGGGPPGAQATVGDLGSGWVAAPDVKECDAQIVKWVRMLQPSIPLSISADMSDQMLLRWARRTQLFHYPSGSSLSISLWHAAALGWDSAALSPSQVGICEWLKSTKRQARLDQQT